MKIPTLPIRETTTTFMTPPNVVAQRSHLAMVSGVVSFLVFLSLLISVGVLTGCGKSEQQGSAGPPAAAKAVAEVTAPVKSNPVEAAATNQVAAAQAASASGAETALPEEQLLTRAELDGFLPKPYASLDVYRAACSNLYSTNLDAILNCIPITPQLDPPINDGDFYKFDPKTVGPIKKLAGLYGDQADDLAEDFSFLEIHKSGPKLTLHRHLSSTQYKEYVLRTETSEADIDSVKNIFMFYDAPREDKDYLTRAAGLDYSHVYCFLQTAIDPNFQARYNNRYWKLPLPGGEFYQYLRLQKHLGFTNVNDYNLYDANVPISKMNLTAPIILAAYYAGKELVFGSVWLGPETDGLLPRNAEGKPVDVSDKPKELLQRLMQKQKYQYLYGLFTFFNRGAATCVQNNIASEETADKKSDTELKGVFNWPNSSNSMSRDHQRDNITLVGKNYSAQIMNEYNYLVFGATKPFLGEIMGLTRKKCLENASWAADMKQQWMEMQQDEVRANIARREALRRLLLGR